MRVYDQGHQGGDEGTQPGCDATHPALLPEYCSEPDHAEWQEQGQGHSRRDDPGQIGEAVRPAIGSPMHGDLRGQVVTDHPDGQG